jgi:hypothetical protein
MSVEASNKDLSVALERLRVTVKLRLDEILEDRKAESALSQVETVKADRPIAASYVNLISRLFRIQRR